MKNDSKLFYLLLGVLLALLVLMGSAFVTSDVSVSQVPQNQEDKITYKVIETEYGTFLCFFYNNQFDCEQLYENEVCLNEVAEQQSFASEETKMLPQPTSTRVGNTPTPPPTKVIDPTPTANPTETTPTPDTLKGNNGHGNDLDRCDSSNPGKKPGCLEDSTDDDGLPPGQQESGGPPGRNRN